MPASSSLIHPVTLLLPHLPQQLEGVRIAHLTDLHVSRPRRRYDRIEALLTNMRVDLAVLTGDYMEKEGDEDAAVTVMGRLCNAMRPRLGAYGVFGNHDTPQLRQRLTDLPIVWLNNQTHIFDQLPLRMMGFEADSGALPDSVATLLEYDASSAGGPAADEASSAGLRVLLCHFPTYLPTAVDLGVDVMFAGHTHGGQCRLPFALPLVNSSDLPLRLTSGILRHRDTLAVVSRGLGEARLPLRIFCPPHLPVYTLRRGPMPGRSSDAVWNVQRW